MKLRAFYNRFLTNSTFEKTAIQTEYSTIDYGEKVILKNSTKSAKQSLLVSIILVTITLYIGSIHLNIVGMLLFCSIILLFPIMKLVNQKPKLIICGASAYSRDWDYTRVREIADKINGFVLDLASLKY